MLDANFPALLQSFFTTRLMAQRKVSSHTIASYRDTFRLLLQFAQKRLRKAPSQLELDNLDASFIGAFLDDLEASRGNAARSRNLRLTAVRSATRHWKRRCTPGPFNVCWRSPTSNNPVPWWIF
jgi:site-specific recombinase XerC